MIKLLFSLSVGALSGFLYAFFAYRSHKLLFSESMKSTFLLRYGLLCFRLLLISGAIFGAFLTGLVEPMQMGVGVMSGYVIFYLIYGVMGWM